MSEDVLLGPVLGDPPPRVTSPGSDSGIEDAAEMCDICGVNFTSSEPRIQCMGCEKVHIHVYALSAILI